MKSGRSVLKPVFRTTLGSLYEADCLDLLPTLKSKSVDTVFADPPFNLGKNYGARCPDYRSEVDYLTWCERWLDECSRVLKPGGALFIYNLPKWNIPLGAHLRVCPGDFSSST
ncbi:MAG TPA: DNA methyltransferase [Hyphomicrobiaceae bacterium]|jgi:site-specific DNA-methyltransferase (adenine-specific)